MIGDDAPSHAQGPASREDTQSVATSRTVPNEVWRMLFSPNQHVQQHRHGIEYERQRWCCKNVLQAFRQVLTHVRCSKSAPLDLQCSHGVELDKRNGNTMCESVRLINVLDRLGKNFYKFLWQRGSPKAAIVCLGVCRAQKPRKSDSTAALLGA